jgi:hypothetical protein
MSLTDKIRYAVPAITDIDFFTTDSPLYDRLMLLNSLRNDLIHLKKLEHANFTYYQALFKRLLDFHSAEVADAVFSFIEAIRPGFLEL